MNNDYLEYALDHIETLEKKYNELKEATSRLPCTSKLLGNLADEFDRMHKMVSSRYVAERIYTLLDELRSKEDNEDDFNPLKEWNASQERIALREAEEAHQNPVNYEVLMYNDGTTKLSETPPGTGFNNPHWPATRSKDESSLTKAWEEFRKKNPHLY